MQRQRIRGAIVAGVAMLLFAAGHLSASQPAPPSAIKVRDYTVGDCVADDTAGFKQAISDWQAAARAHSTGVLDLGSGCYRTTDTLSFGRTDGQVTFGEVRGDSPGLAQIHPGAGVSPAVDFRRYKYSSVHGISLVGVNATGVGMLLSNLTPDMGTNNLTFQDLTFANFDTCLQLGERGGPHDGAAAAAITFIQLMATGCNTGIYETSFNTLDTTFINLSLGQNLVGFAADSAHQVFFHTGSGAGNTETFKFLGPGNYVLDGWREEPTVGTFATLGGAVSAATTVSIRNSMVYGATTPGVPALQSNGFTNLEVTQSHIGGDILVDTRDGSTIITGSSIYSSAPWLPRALGSGMYYNQKGNFKPYGPGDVAQSVPYVKFPDLEGRTVDGKPQ